MDSTDKSLGFGRYLKTVRQERGMSLEEVSWDTRVGVETLNLIENERVDHLPAEVFVKGFLRAYARSVGADGDRAVRDYEARLGRFQKSAKSEAELSRLNTRFWSKLLLSLCVLALVMVVSILTMNALRTDEAARPPVTPEAPGRDAAAQKETVAAEKEPAGVAPVNESTAGGPVDQGPAGAPAVPPDPTPGDGEPVNAVSQNDMMRLDISATEETWIKVIADGAMPREFTLMPGDRLRLDARESFNLLIGNAAGVSMTLDEKPVLLKGKSGQVVTLQLP